MNSITLQKLNTLRNRLKELETLLIESASSDPARYRTLTSEYAQLQPVVSEFQGWERIQSELSGLKSLLEDPEPELREMARHEQELLHTQADLHRRAIEKALLPVEKEADQPCYLEVRAGTGGEEASLFCADLFRMYTTYATSKGWEVQVQDRSFSETGGLKEVLLRVEGKGAYGRLRHETGGHRVQRVPETETQGRVHTSACVVLTTPEPPKQEAVTINPSDLRIDTFRASGAGGQHVNKTDSAVRITHLATGLVATCQDGRSQIQNRESALRQLAARLKALEEEKRQQAEHALRQSLLSSGRRTDRIRTYNYPQGRITDHRISLTLYQLESIMDGQLDLLLNPLLEEYQTQRLAAYQSQGSPLTP